MQENVEQYWIPPQVLDIPNHMASQANQIYYQTVFRSWYLMGQEARYPWKSWVFNSCFSFKVRQHDQQKLYFQYKVCWILYEIVGSPSFSQPCLCKQADLESPPKILSSISVNIHLPFPRLLFNKIILTIHTNTPFVYTAAFFHLPIFAYNHPSNLHQKCFPYLSHLANSGCV